MIPDFPQTPTKSLKARADSLPLNNPASPHAGEESAQPLSLSLGQVQDGLSFAEDTTRKFLQRTGTTLSKPLSALGKMLGDVMDGLDRDTSSGNGGTSTQGGVGTYLPGPFAPLEMARERGREQQHQQHRSASSVPSTPFTFDNGPATPQPFQAPYKPRVRHFPSSSGPATPASGRSTPDSTPSRVTGPMQIPGAAFRSSSPGLGQGSGRFALETPAGLSRSPSPGLDIPGLQQEIDQAHDRAASAALGTLTQIFPVADREVLEWVLEAENGDLGKSIEKMLEISGSS